MSLHSGTRWLLMKVARRGGVYGPMRWAIVSLLLVVFGPRLAWASEPASEPASSSINRILGDVSWYAVHGEAPGPDDLEVDRIRTHLLYVEGLLRRADVSGLTPAQRDNRARALDALASYRDAGVFPRRTADAYAGRRPRFIDDRGVHCAVGEMIRATGHAELAAAVDRDHEYAYVLDMDSASLRVWARDFGFRPLELAMIQPSYAQPPSEDSMRQVLASATDDFTLECAALHEPVSRFRVRIRGNREGRARVFAARRDPFVRCFVDKLRQLEPGGDAWDHSPKPYRFGVVIRPTHPQTILESRFEQLPLEGKTNVCIPQPGALAETADIRLQVDARGRTVEVRTTPSNPEMETCLERLIHDQLYPFVAGRWSLGLTTTLELGRRVTSDSLTSNVEHGTPSLATECYEFGQPKTASVRVRAVHDAPEFEVEVEGEPSFAECLGPKLQERLRSSFEVSRKNPNGEYERYFRIDADAEVRVSVDVESPEARAERVQQEFERLEQEKGLRYD